MRDADIGCKVATRAFQHRLLLFAMPMASRLHFPRIAATLTHSLTEDGMHQWFGGLKRHANHEEWELIADLSFHDLRHDFAHRAREAGWTLEELAYYLGHVTMKGIPAIQTTVRYTQVSRAQVKGKLKLLKG